MQFIENRTYDELRAGDSVTLARHLRIHDVRALAALAGERLQSFVCSRQPGPTKRCGAARSSRRSSASGPARAACAQPEPALPRRPAHRAPLQLFLRLRTGTTPPARCCWTAVSATPAAPRWWRVRCAYWRRGRASGDRAWRRPTCRGWNPDRLPTCLKATRALPPLPTAVVHPAMSCRWPVRWKRRENLILPLLVGLTRLLERAWRRRPALALDGAEIVDVPTATLPPLGTAPGAEGRAQALMKARCTPMSSWPR